jgi:uncharacterized MAPEG superfamily protein
MNGEIHTMNTATYCVIAAGLMPFMWVAASKISAPRYNNRDVRLWQSRLEGLPSRAHAAHLNSFEAFPLFAIAVLFAMHNQAPQQLLDLYALSFIGLRVVYGVLYIANQPTLRSLVWFAAIICNVRIFFLHA